MMAADQEIELSALSLQTSASMPIGAASAAIANGTSVVAATYPAAVDACRPDGPDAAIVSAWHRRVAAHGMIAGGELDSNDTSLAPYWTIVDECDDFIQSTVANTPVGVEVQIWTALHNSSAYVKDEEQAILRMDLDYLAAHASAFDWDAKPMIAALRSLRAMGA